MRPGWYGGAGRPAPGGIVLPASAAVAPGGIEPPGGNERPGGNEPPGGIEPPGGMEAATGGGGTELPGGIGERPVAAKAIVPAQANTSEAGVAGSPWNCSGAM